MVDNWPNRPLRPAGHHGYGAPVKAPVSPGANPHLKIWEVDEADYPTAGPVDAQLRFLLRYAILAPSSHNTQPWLFSVRDRSVEIYVDHTRALRITDPDDRQMAIACGCALFHLRIAMEHFGHTPRVERFPSAGDFDLIARVTVDGEAFSSDANEKLFAAIPRRHTYRQMFKEDPLPHEFELALKEAMTDSSAWVHFVKAADERHMLADLVARGDQVQWATKKFRLELAAWTHPDTTHANSGIPHYSLDSNDLLTYAEPHVIRTFDLGNGQAAKDRDIALYSPGLCVVGTAYDNSHAWLEAGEGLAHLLLLARHHHVYASFLNQPIEVEDLRPRVARTIRSNGHAQLILRLGYGAHVNPTPRRTVAEVLI